MPRRAAYAVFAALLGMALAPDSLASERASMRVLFVGNSHTATNGLPRVVEKLAKERGVELETTAIAQPGMSLGDHLADGRLQQALRDGDWDWVVLQQGPSSRPESRANLIRSVAAISAEVGPLSTRIALLSVWPHRRQRAVSLAAEESYRQAAVAIDACVLPAATAWRHAMAAERPPRLYQRDQLHATKAGTVLTALTILPGLIGDERSGLPAMAAEAPDGVSGTLHAMRVWAWRAHHEELQSCGRLSPVEGV